MARADAREKTFADGRAPATARPLKQRILVTRRCDPPRQRGRGGACTECLHWRSLRRARGFWCQLWCQPWGLGGIDGDQICFYNNKLLILWGLLRVRVPSA